MASSMAGVTNGSSGLSILTVLGGACQLATAVKVEDHEESARSIFGARVTRDQSVEDKEFSSCDC